ncbi:MAG: hypothetical protein ABI172_13640 [Ginsengibacter sp.]
MKHLLLLLLISTFLLFNSEVQVNQINVNKRLQGVILLNNTLAIFEPRIDSSIRVSVRTKSSATPISGTIRYIGGGSLLNGKCICRVAHPLKAFSGAFPTHLIKI